MHDWRPSGREPTSAIEDDIHHEIRANDLADGEDLDECARQPRRYLPPRPLRKRKRERNRPQPVREGKLARRAKLGALLLVTALLATSLVVAAALAHSTESNATASPAEIRITGTAALGRFTVPDGTNGTSFESHQSHTASSAPTLPATGATAEQKPRSATGAATEPANTTDFEGDTPKSAHAEIGDSRTATDRPTDRLSTVRTFYDLVDTSPDEALALLDPALREEDRDFLLQSWQSLTSVQVHDVREESDGNVRVVVTMNYSDGRRVRLTQLLALTGGTETLISDATLLSAIPD